MNRYQGSSRPVSGGWKSINLSFYHPTGNCTASGAVMDPGRLTVAADGRYPLGATLELRNPDTGKVVEVFVSDRCPPKSCTAFNRVDGTLATLHELGGNSRMGVKKDLQVRVVAVPS